MIDTICNVSKKSFKDYSYGEHLKQCNIFFGTNGSGKSSLATWISENNLFVKTFDTDYVLNNISMVDSMSGVQLTVGSERIEIEEAIKNVEEANINLEDKIKENNIKVLNYKNEIYEFMNLQLNEARNQFKLTKNIMQKKNAKENTLLALKSWDKEIIDDSEDEKLSSSASIELELKKLTEELHEIILNTSFNISDFSLLNEILQKEIVKPEYELSLKLNAWLEDGLRLHEEDENFGNKKVCKFCQNSFDYFEIKKEIEEKIHSEYANSINDLEKYYLTFNELLQSLKKHSLNNKDISMIVQNDIEEIIHSITDKLANPSKIILLSPDFPSNYNYLMEAVQKKSEYIKSEIEVKNGLLNEIEKVAKSWTAKKILAKYPIIEVSKKLDLINDSNKLYSELIDDNKKWIRENKPCGDLKRFSDLLNYQFQSVGINVKCEIFDNRYLLKHNVDSSKVISTRDLSEGEKRLLGFLHFYYDLFFEEEKSLKNEIEYIILDDPITSLDSDNRYYMTELINNIIRILTDLNAQVFIFTHSSIDFHNFGFGNNNQKILKSIIFKDNDGLSKIRKVDNQELKNFSDYYRINFANLYQFAKITNSNIADCNDFLRFANLGRLIFESHARSNYRIENTTSTVINKLKQLYKIPEEKSGEFKEMVDVLNSLSHGLSYYDVDVNTITPRMIRDSIRKLIGVLYKLDKNHVITMIGLAHDSRELELVESWF